MSLDQPIIRRQRVRLAGRSPEPAVPIEHLLSAIQPDEVERLRPLLPIGYEAGAAAYRAAAAELTARDLANHYTSGLAFFHDRFVPHLKGLLEDLSGGVWNLADFVPYAAGSDVDLMTHLIEAIAARSRVCLFPGDWFGFQVGVTQTANLAWDATGDGELACLCVPSVRNGHVTEEMLAFLKTAPHCLLNLNLYPTLTADERRAVAEDLQPLLGQAVLSISFSRGFGLTASQLGVFLVHRDHPYRTRFETQWTWFTYFFNALAARAFILLDLPSLEGGGREAANLGTRMARTPRIAGDRDRQLLREILPADRHGSGLPGPTPARRPRPALFQATLHLRLEWEQSMEESITTRGLGRITSRVSGRVSADRSREESSRESAP